ncbi:hypothetical protein AAHE18_17G124800 [Arachis hypogaea]
MSCCATAAWVARNGALSAGWWCATAGCEPVRVVLTVAGASWCTGGRKGPGSSV